MGLIVSIYLLLLYPGFIMIGLLKNQHRIEEKKFKKAFNELFKGIFTNSKQALLYESFFCLRRFTIVFINILFTINIPMNFQQNHYFHKIMIFLVIQSLYVWYVNDTRPHTNNLFNRLEFFNEGSLMFLAYLMLGYSEILPFVNSGGGGGRNQRMSHGWLIDAMDS